MMRLPTLHRTVLLATLLACSGIPLAGEAGIYRWTDGEGVQHFGDRPPPGVQAERLRPGGGLGRTPAAAPDPEPEQDATQTAEQTRPLRDTDIPPCAEARQTLTSYTSASRIIETDLLGEERELSEEQRARLIARQERIVERACGDDE